MFASDGRGATDGSPSGAFRPGPSTVPVGSRDAGRKGAGVVGFGPEVVPLVYNRRLPRSGGVEGVPDNARVRVLLTRFARGVGTEVGTTVMGHSPYGGTGAILL